MTSLSEPFIRRPVMTVLLTITVMLFGVIAYRDLPVNDLPAVDFPVIEVSASYPGASPETMASSVATPLERQFMQIPGIELITSDSRQGITRFNLQFRLNKSVDAAATDVQSAINAASGSLPLDMPSPPTFSKYNPNDSPIIYLALTSNSLTEGQLYDYATTEVAQRLATVNGVAKIDVFGPKGGIRVKVDPGKLAAKGMTMDELAAAVRAGSAYQAVGQFDGPTTTFVLQPQGQLENAEAYGNLVVKRENGANVYLKDVADVYDSTQDERMKRNFWRRGKPEPATSVVLAVRRQAGSNAVETTRGIREMLPYFERELPGSISLELMFDRSVSIINSVNEVKETLLIAFALVVIVIFAFLGRASDTLIPVVALPISILITFIVMKLLNYSIDNLSLLALTLSIGFLVDDAIVFLENVVRRMEGGEKALEATLNGAKEISFTILSMTLSLAVVFLPLVFMPGVIGRTFQQFAITIIVAILASGVVSLTLTPLMCARMMVKHESGEKTWLEKAVASLFVKVNGVYGRSLDFFLEHRWISAVCWAACMVGTVLAFQAVPKSFLPTGDSGFVRGIFSLEEGVSPERMSQFQTVVDEVLREHPAVDIAYTISGNSRQMPASQARILAFLVPQKERAPIHQVIEELSAKLRQVPGIRPSLQPVPVLQISSGATSNTQGRFAYTITGLDAKEVSVAADDLMEKLRGYPGFTLVDSNAKNRTPNLRIDIKREQAASYGVSAQAILSTLRNAYAQNYVYLIKRETDQYQVIVEVDEAFRSEPDNLSLLYVRSDSGKMVPLKAVAKWQEVAGPQSINHLNQLPAITLFFNLAPDVVLGDAADFIEKTAAETLPETVHGKLQGEALIFKETISSLTVLIIFAVFAMYIILGILYESYIHPITVLTALPVATVGGLVTLLVFGMDASLYAFVGLFLLIGIVKKNGIMIVDFALQRMAEGLDRKAAIHEASLERLRPILMTTFAALMGAVPLALAFGPEGKSRQPLGMVIVGGLIVSQLVTLYVTPALFLYLEEFQEKVLDRFSFFRSHRASFVAIEKHDDEAKRSLTVDQAG